MPDYAGTEKGTEGAKCQNACLSIVSEWAVS